MLEATVKSLSLEMFAFVCIKQYYLIIIARPLLDRSYHSHINNKKLPSQKENVCKGQVLVSLAIERSYVIKQLIKHRTGR